MLMNSGIGLKLILSRLSLLHNSHELKGGNFHKIVSDLDCDEIFPDWPTISSENFYNEKDYPPVFVLDARPLKVRMNVASTQRGEFSKRLSFFLSRGYQLVDAFADGKSFLWFCILAKPQIWKSSEAKATFVTGNKIYDFKFESFENRLRNSCLLAGNFYERYMLEDCQKFYNGGNVIDVGANIGNHSVFFADMVADDSTVVCFECNPIAIDLLHVNLRSNCCDDRTRVMESAAGSVKGTAVLVAGSDQNLGAASVSTDVTHSASKNTVEVVALDDALNDLSAIDLIKVDVEGFELEVLKGAKEVLLSHKPTLYIELGTEEAKSTMDKFLAPIGYQAEVKFNDTPTWRYRTRP